MQEWEYKVVQARLDRWNERENAERELNKLGHDGWELVTTIHPDDGYDCIFLLKRSKNINPSRREVDQKCIVCQSPMK